MAGVAALYGNRRLDVTLTAGGTTGSASFNDYGTVFNADAMASTTVRFYERPRVSSERRADV